MNGELSSPPANLRPSGATAATAEAPDAADAADLLAELGDPAAVAYLRALPPDKRAETFAYLDFPQQRRMVGLLERSALAQILTDLRSDDRARFFRGLEPPDRSELLTLLPSEQRDAVGRLISFAQETAGALMTVEYASAAPEWTVDRALDALRRAAPRRELVETVFVTGGDGRLLGRAQLVDLFTASPQLPVLDFMQPVRWILATADQEEAASIIARYDLAALPVVNEERQLLGIITQDDALEVLEDEHNEDVQLASGIGPEPVTSYTDASTGLLVRKRIVWLLILLMTALASASVIAAFEQTLAAAVALAFFIPVVTGSGGNTGTQSATLIIRALATGDVSPGDWARVFGKEILVGAVLGACMAAAVFGIGLVWPGARSIAPVVAATMVALVIWANVVGALLPMLLRRLGADPAVAGAPLVSTVVDASGLLIYFGMARLLLTIPGD